MNSTSDHKNSDNSHIHPGNEIQNISSINPVQAEDAFRIPGRKIFTAVITGGPCAGKTTAIAYIKNKLSQLGYHVIEVSETATTILKANIHPWDSPAFQKAVFSLQKCWEDTLHEQAEFIQNPKCAMICDRGLMDGKAYCPPGAFEKIAGGFSLSAVDIFSRYDLIIHMVSAADGAEEFYSTDSNHERMESAEEARFIEKRTLHAWDGHPNRICIDNSTGIDEKIERVWQSLEKSLSEYEKSSGR